MSYACFPFSLISITHRKLNSLISNCQPLLSTIWFALCSAAPHLTPLCRVSIRTGLCGRQARHASSHLFSTFQMFIVDSFSIFGYEKCAFNLVKVNTQPFWRVYSEAGLQIPSISPFVRDRKHSIMCKSADKTFRIYPASSFNKSLQETRDGWRARFVWQ